MLERTKRRPLLWGIATWLVMGVLLQVIRVDLYNTLWVMAIPILLLYWLGGLSLALLSWPKGGRTAWSLRAFAPLAVVVLGGLGLWVWGPLLGTRVRFEFERSEFERIVRELELSTPEMMKDARGSGGDYIVEAGPPLRVAFPWNSGVVDNWTGVVYDPTGYVMQANRVTPGRAEDPSMQAVKNLFGGDMFWCRRLDKEWYLCGFT